jgi:outer membrane protein assembly factor BamA
LLLLWFPLLAGAEEIAEPPRPPAVIDEIRFAGNKTTRPEVLLQEMTIKVGDPVDTARIEQSRQAIMDLGIFKSVSATILPEGSRTVLLITVKEKYYILPIPKLNRDADNNFSLGAQLRLDNLAGLNQRFKLTYETERAASSDAQRQTTSLEYIYPRVRGSFYDLEVYASRARTPVDSADPANPYTYESEFSSAQVNVNHWLRRDLPGKGWRAGGGLVWQAQKYNFFTGTPPDLQDGRGVGVTAVIEYTFVHDYLYSRAGKVYGYQGTYGVPSLGSDSNYTTHQLYYRGYYPLFNKPHRTLDVQVKFGMGSDPLFGPAFSIGGSSSLRGYPSGSIAGNAYFLTNIEYLTPLFDYYQLREVVFLDIGNAYPSNHDIRLSGMKTAVGVGLRLKLKSFVNIDLRVDYAYAIDTGETKVYAGTKEAF